MDWLNELAIDVDRMNYFAVRNDTERVEEYKNLIVSHVKEMVKEHQERILSRKQKKSEVVYDLIKNE